MPRPGVEGRGGEAGLVLRIEGRDARDTGLVGRETVMGMEVAVVPLRVKQLDRTEILLVICKMGAGYYWQIRAIR